MKLFALLVFASLNVFAQSIQKTDGTFIDVTGGQIHVEAGNKRLAYFQKESKKAQYIKFKDLDQAVWGDFLFKTFEIGGKRNGYYVVAKDGDKTLLVSKRSRNKSRGGFESTYTRYELVVLDGKLNEQLVFTDENSDKKIEQRRNIIPMIKTHFQSCKPLIEKVTAFESPASDTSNRTVLVFLNDPVYVQCK